MTKKIKPVMIGGIGVGPGYPVRFVAEEGINHCGSLTVANELTDLALEAEADFVKLQTRTVEVVYSQDELNRPREVPPEILLNAIRREVLSSEAIQRLRQSDFENSTNGDLKRLLEFTDPEYQGFDRHCREVGMPWFTACWDVGSLERMVRLFPDLPAHKIASPCNQDRALLRRARDTGKPLILSTGMSNFANLQRAIKYIGTDNLIILHCKSIYPSSGLEADETVLKKLNLRCIQTLQETFGVPVGYSGHESGIQPAYAAATFGACLIEKHVTLKRSMWGADQSWSTNRVDLARLIRLLHELPLILGDGQIGFDIAEEVAEKKLRRVRWEDGERE